MCRGRFEAAFAGRRSAFRHSATSSLNRRSLKSYPKISGPYSLSSLKAPSGTTAVGVAQVGQARLAHTLRLEAPKSGHRERRQEGSFLRGNRGGDANLLAVLICDTFPRLAKPGTRRAFTTTCSCRSEAATDASRPNARSSRIAASPF